MSFNSVTIKEALDQGGPVAFLPLARILCHGLFFVVLVLLVQVEVYVILLHLGALVLVLVRAICQIRTTLSTKACAILTFFKSLLTLSESCLRHKTYFITFLQSGGLTPINDADRCPLNQNSVIFVLGSLNSTLCWLFITLSSFSWNSLTSLYLATSS